MRIRLPLITPPPVMTDRAIAIAASEPRDQQRTPRAKLVPAAAVIAQHGSVLARAGHGIVDRLDLQCEVVRHRRSRRLVFRVPVVPEGLSLGVEHARPIIRRYFALQSSQHVDHAVDGAGGFAGLVAQVGQGMESAVEVRRCVDQQQCLQGATNA